MGKYLHIFNTESKVKFAKSLICAIQAPENGFCIEDHDFVTYSSAEYDVLKDYDHVLYLKLDDLTYATAAAVNHYGDDYEWIFVHGINNPYSVPRIKRRHRKKIIWRTWGHDTGFPVQGSLPSRLFQWCFNHTVFRSFVKSIRGVGIANITDSIAIRKKAGIRGALKNSFVLGYMTMIDGIEALIDDASAARYGVDQSALNVLVGHSAHVGDCHCEVIDAVRHFRGEPVRFIFPISYGNDANKERIKDYARRQLGEDRVVLLDQFMPLQDYYAIIRACDIGILAGSGSAALANVGMLLASGKTVYLRKNGVLAQAFREKEIPFRCVEEIQTLTFAEFSTLCEGVGDKLREAHSRAEYIDLWRHCLAKLG